MEAGGVGGSLQIAFLGFLLLLFNEMSLVLIPFFVLIDSLALKNPVWKE